MLSDESFCVNRKKRKMPYMHMEPEEKHVIPSSQMVLKSLHGSKDDEKTSLWKRKGKRRAKGSTMEGLKQEELDPNLEFPSSSSCKSLTFPRRPDFGSLGTKCLVKANHFLAKIPESDISHYNVRWKQVIVLIRRFLQRGNRNMKVECVFC